MSKTFCPIPWIFQAARNNGDLRVCCQANVSPNQGILRDEQGKIYNAAHANLAEARNAPLMKDMRRQMLKGEWPEECGRCQSEEASGLNSRRIYEQETWSFDLHKAQGVTQEDGTLDCDNSPVIYYDLRFGNKCNLACRMCGPTDSDAWYADYTRLTGEKFYKDSHGAVELKLQGKKWVDPSRSYFWYESSSFWEQLKKWAPRLQHIYMAGGEPLMIQEHEDFLSRCVREGLSQNMRLEYNTNLTLLPPKILELWTQFKQVRVGASIDGYGEVFELQRYPAKWKPVYRNLQKLDALTNNVVTWLAFTVTIYNVWHLPEFMEWKVKDSGFLRINSSKKRPVITHHMAHKPRHLNVRVLSDRQKDLVSQHFAHAKRNIMDKYDHQLAPAALQILNSVETYMRADSYYDSHYKQMLNYTKKLDEIRGQDSFRLLPYVDRSCFVSQS